MSWKTNVIMEFFDPRPFSPTFGQWVKISDHGRAPLEVSPESIETKQVMADGSKRKYVVARKRIWSTSWTNFPNRQVDFLINGQPGDWMEKFYNDVTGAFKVRFRTGQDREKQTSDPALVEATVFISSFGKEVVNRGRNFDMWNMDLTLEEA